MKTEETQKTRYIKEHNKVMKEEQNKTIKKDKKCINKFQSILSKCLRIKIKS